MITYIHSHRLQGLITGLLVLIGAGPLFCQSTTQTELFASLPAELTSRIVVQQSEATKGYGVRFDRAKTTTLSAVQTFIWPVGGCLDGVGLKLFPNQNNLTGSPLNYHLRIFSLPNLSTGWRELTQLLAEIPFSVGGDRRQSTDYLYLKCPSSLSLAKGGSYAFQVVLRSQNSTRLTLATSQGGISSYAEGSGYVVSMKETDTSVSIPSKASTWSYVFFLTQAQP